MNPASLFAVCTSAVYSLLKMILTQMWDSNQILLYKWGPRSYLTLYQRVYQVRVAMERLWLALDEDQPKVSVSLTLDFDETMSDKKFGPLVVTLSLEFSRLPAMLSPLKTTLFPVPALTPRRQIGECIHCSTWRYWSCEMRLAL